MHNNSTLSTRWPLYPLDCTEERPFSPAAIVAFVLTLGIERGAVTRLRVLHDEDADGRCPWCGPQVRR